MSNAGGKDHAISVMIVAEEAATGQPPAGLLNGERDLRCVGARARGGAALPAIARLEPRDSWRCGAQRGSQCHGSECCWRPGVPEGGTGCAVPGRAGPAKRSLVLSILRDLIHRISRWKESEIV